MDIIKENAIPMSPIPTRVSPRLKQLPNIKAIIFDVYGTMFISESGDVQPNPKTNDIFLRVFKENQINIPPDINIQKLFYGILKANQERRRKQNINYPEVEIRGVWKDLLQKLNVNASQDLIETLAIYFEALANPIWPMPHLVKTLTHLQKSSLVLSIISNAQFFSLIIFEALLNKSLAELGFLEETCIWSYRILEAKPSIRLFELSAKSLNKIKGIEPKEALYIGNDIRNDIKPAAKLGFRTALFAGDKRSLRLRKEDPTCKNISPDLILTDIQQLLECI